MLPESQAFRQSRPVLLTTFTNKAASIGLSLVPILLVKRGVSTGEGAFVLAALKTMVLAGTLAGGALSDRISSRTLVLVALLMSACGLGLLPFQTTLAMIVVCGVLAQFAESLMNVAQRVLLVGQVDAPHQKEALGWLRMVNNAAQVFSFTIAAASARFGVAPLMVLDASTSLGAFVVGRGLLPKDEGEVRPDRGFGWPDGGAASSRWAFFGLAAVLMGWSGLYELFLEGGAGRLEALHPGQGLARFSSMMVLNTVLCAFFAVRASRTFHRAWPAIAAGAALTAAGILIAAWGMAREAQVLAGMVCVTAGEIMLGALSQYTLMRLTPAGRNAGFYYSTGLTLMQCGRIAGAALAFPLFIHAAGLGAFTALVGAALALMLLLLWSLKGEIERLA